MKNGLSCTPLLITGTTSSPGDTAYIISVNSGIYPEAGNSRVSLNAGALNTPDIPETRENTTTAANVHDNVFTINDDTHSKPVQLA